MILQVKELEKKCQSDDGNDVQDIMDYESDNENDDDKHERDESNVNERIIPRSNDNIYYGVNENDVVDERIDKENSMV